MAASTTKTRKLSRPSLTETHPNIAAEAHGWDPSAVSAGSHNPATWKCGKCGKTWDTSSISYRITWGVNCRACNGIKYVKNRDPLVVTHPDVAKDAHGWDPSKVTAGSGKVLPWQCHKCGHEQTTSVSSRVTGPGCSDCNPRTWSKNLSETHPNLAAEAYGWDPSTVTAGSGKVLPWQCSKCYNIWTAKVAHRVQGAYKCGVCSPVAFPRKNVYLSDFPKIAKEADGWNPSEFRVNSREIKDWKCSSGHRWKERISNRYYRCYRGKSKLYGCRECAGKINMEYTGELAKHKGHSYQVVNERTSLATLYPAIAEELKDQTIGRQVSPWSHLRVEWICKTCSHEWMATPNSRVSHNTGCPKCSKTGYDTTKVGWLYYIEKNIINSTGLTITIKQYGVTNQIKKRLRQHRREGFLPFGSEFLYFENGEQALLLEKEIKSALNNSGVIRNSNNTDTRDKFSGYTESFQSSLMGDGSNTLRTLIETFDLSKYADKGLWTEYPKE